jgi:hypothetical protein
MAIDALADTSPAQPAPGRPMRRLVCACGSSFSAQSRPDRLVLGPWVDAHSQHDDGLRARAEVTFP